MDDPDDPDYGFNVWYNGKIEYEGFDEDWGGDVFGFTMYDEDGDEIRWSDIYPALKTGPDTDALDYEWINIKDAGQPIKFVGGKRRKKKTRKMRGGLKEEIPPFPVHLISIQSRIDYYTDENVNVALNQWWFERTRQQRADILQGRNGTIENPGAFQVFIDTGILLLRNPPQEQQQGGNKTKKKKETKCAGIKNAFGVCMTAANKSAAFNKRVIKAQDTSLGQLKTQYPSMLMGYPSDRGGGRKKKGGLLGPRELEAGRQYLYTGPEPHILPQMHWQTPVRITVTYRGRNVPGLTPNRHYFDGEREFNDIFSLNDDDIEQHIQPWVQNPRPPVAPAAVVPRPRRESTCENCTIMGGRKKRGGYGPGVTEEQARREREEREEKERIEAEAAAAAAAAAEQKQNIALIRRANRISRPGVTIDNITDARETIATKEAHDYAMAEAMPRASEVPRGDWLNEGKGTQNPLVTPSAQMYPSGIIMATEIKNQRVGGRKTKRRRKKHKKTRRR
jgi:hypothetical protein